jgi:multidrug efflux pump subunit AcrA (membrane-fusion protein)
VTASIVALSRLRPAVPTLERRTLTFDTVTVGEMLREVRAPGTLVAEHTRIIVAVTGGRIEALPVQPGQNVGASTTVVELSNPDVERSALEVQQALTQAYASQAQLRSSLAQQRMTQLGVIAQLRTQSRDADRAAEVLDTLDKSRLAARNEVAAAHDRAAEYVTRYQLEQRRLTDLERAEAEQLRLYDEQIAGLRRIVAEQQRRVASMRVTAGEPGQIQTLGTPQLELGQWVNSGVELARVTQPGRLKAVLKIPDSQASELAVGQSATIDTHDGIIRGRVARIDPASRSGAVAVDVMLEGPLPRSARPDVSVDGAIVIERLHNVLHIGRPAYGGQESTVRLFRVVPNAGEALSVEAHFGRASVSTMEIRRGLVRGDSVIISDMSQFANDTRVRLH